MSTSSIYKGCVAGAALMAALMQAPVAFALDNSPATGVVVKPVASMTTTASGQPITLPQKNAQVVVSTYEIPAGAVLPVHKHPFPRYAYVQAGNLQVTNTVTGKTNSYAPGDFIIEMINEWHRGANLGSEPVRLLVIDQVEHGESNTVLQN